MRGMSVRQRMNGVTCIWHLGRGMLLSLARRVLTACVHMHVVRSDRRPARALRVSPVSRMGGVSHSCRGGAW